MPCIRARGFALQDSIQCSKQWEGVVTVHRHIYGDTSLYDSHFFYYYTTTSEEKVKDSWERRKKTLGS